MTRRSHRYGHNHLSAPFQRTAAVAAAAGRRVTLLLFERSLPIRSQYISPYDVKCEHEWPLQLRSERAPAKQTGNPLNRSGSASHLLQRDGGGVPLTA